MVTNKKMKRDDLDFMERISLDLETRRMACKVLDVDETADKKLEIIGTVTYFSK